MVTLRATAVGVAGADAAGVEVGVDVEVEVVPQTTSRGASVTTLLVLAVVVMCTVVLEPRTKVMVAPAVGAAVVEVVVEVGVVTGSTSRVVGVVEVAEAVPAVVRRPHRSGEHWVRALRSFVEGWGA